MKDTPLLFWVISGKNAIQSFFMLLIAFSGITIALGLASAQNPMYSHLPMWANIAFGVSLILGAVANFISVYWRGKAENGIELEARSVLWLAAACVIFAAIVSHDPVARAQPGAASSIVMCFLFAGFCIGRYRQCRKALKEVAKFKTALEAMRDA